MKKSLITVLCAGCFYFGFSQNDYNPPRHVRESFQKEYPQSQPGQWNHSSAGWSVNFDDRDHNNGEVTAHFDGSGRHIDTHVPYDNNDVPAPVMDHVRSRYPGSDQYDVTRIDRSGQGVYQFRLRHQKKSRTLYLDENGQQRNDYRDRHY
jgi:hypothetical protein